MPHTGHRPIVLLLTSTLVIAILAMIMIPGLGRAQEGTEEETPPPVSQEQEGDLLAVGDDLYNRTCIACHQAGGTGAESDVTFTYYPPLADNPFVTIEDPTAVVQTILFGRGGMPAFRGLSDEEIAGIVTYIRQEWGNDASAVSPEFVTEIRAERDVPPPEPATPFPTEPLSEGTPVLDGTPVTDGTPGIQDPAQPRERTPAAEDESG